MKERLKKYAWRKFRHYPKTREITELREELYSMMCDKYDDCISQGINDEESEKRAKALMNDCKSAVREVEKNSSRGALRRKLINLLVLSAAFMLLLTGVYLYLSLSVYKSFDKTWMLIVTGAFVYLVYVAVSLFAYARMFGFPKLSRLAFAGIFVSVVPLIYVLPGLISTVFLGHSIWGKSWLIVPVILFCYLVCDTFVFSRGRRMFLPQLALCGLALATVIFLSLSVLFGKWKVAWLIYILYLAIVAFVIYIIELRKNRSRDS